MSDRPHIDTEQPKLGWKFPRTFWIANGAELFERAAFYGMFITLVYYLTSRLGFSDIWASIAGAYFGGVIYFLPTFLGAMADRIGFRRALMLAFGCLTIGYALLGFAGVDKDSWSRRQQGVPANLTVGHGSSGAHTAETDVTEPGAGQDAGPTSMAPVIRRLTAPWRKVVAMLALTIVMFGGAIVKPTISGTVAKCSDEAHRPRAFSIFYWMVNLGSFMGKGVAPGVRQQLGLEFINFYAALMGLCAFLLVVFLYRDVGTRGGYKTARQAWEGFLKVIRNGRFMALILIVAGFWLIQGQLYASMTKYIIRLLGESAKPEWLANINPLVVIICVVPITHMVRSFKPENCIGIGLFIIPFTAVAIGMSPWLEKAMGGAPTEPGSFWLHPITLVVILGIGLQGLAECFLSPKFLEYASRQAPEGEEGLYLGYQHLTTFFAWVLGFFMSGVLLDHYCPDPEKLRRTDPEMYEQWRLAIETGGQMPAAYANANVMWYWFAAVGFAAFLSLLLFKFVTGRIDRSGALAAGA